MTHPPNRHANKRSDPSNPKRTRSNSLGEAQVLPPHHVDLTLAPTPEEEIRVPPGANNPHQSDDKPKKKSSH